MRTSRRVRRVLIPAAAAALLAGCGSGVGVQTGSPPTASTLPGPTGTTPPTSATSAVHSRAAAAALARSLLAGAVLPPGARPVQAPPAHALRSANWTPGTPNLAQATRFATTSRSMAATAAYLQAHRPKGTSPGGTGTATSHGIATDTMVTDVIGGTPFGASSAQLVYSVAPLPGGGAGIRVDAQVTWLPAKPAAATVPGGDRVAVVSVVETVPGGRWKQEHLPAPRRVTVTDTAAVRALREAADGLVMAPPGARSCPVDLGTRYVVAFAPAAGAHPDRTYTAGSCDEVAVTGPSGRTIATLADDTAFDHAYRSVLGPGG